MVAALSFHGLCWRARFRNGSACPCVRSKGGGDGRRPAPGDIRTPPLSLKRSTNPLLLFCQEATKNAAPDVPEAAPGESVLWKGSRV